MSNLYWLTEAQMDRLQPYFPKSRGRARVDDRRVLSGIILFNRNGLRWCDAPAAYGPPKILYNRWKRWSDMGIFAQILMGLAEQAPRQQNHLNRCHLPQGTSYGLQPAVKKGGRGRLIGLTKGGMNTKPHAVTPSHGLQANHCRAMDTSGRTIRFVITAGQVSDYTGAATVMNGLPEAEWLLAPSHRNYVSTAGQWTEGVMLTGSAKP